MAVMLPALGSAGCSMTLPLSQFLGSMKLSQPESDPATTGSINPSGVKLTDGSVLEGISDGDMARARDAVFQSLAEEEQGAAAPWVNDESGVRGSATPIAAAYTSDGQECRDFLLSFVTGTSEKWAQGEACRHDGTGWQIRALKPWNRKG